MIEYNDNLLHIHATDLLQIIDKDNPIIIDIREPHELDEASIPNAINIPMITLLNNALSLLDREKVYYILCHTGQRSYYVTKVLTENGYRVINVVGGIDLMPIYNHF